MANVIFNSFKQRLFTNGLSGLNWTQPGTTVNVMLLGSSWATPSLTAEDIVNASRQDVLAYEVSGAGYTAGGQALTGKTTSINTSTNTITLTASNVTWSSSTLSNVQFAVLYIPLGGAATADMLIAAYDFGSPKSSSNDNFTFTVNASGLLTLA